MTIAELRAERDRLRTVGNLWHEIADAPRQPAKPKRTTKPAAKRTAAADRETRVAMLSRAYYYGTTDQRRQAAAELRKLAQA